VGEKGVKGEKKGQNTKNAEKYDKMGNKGK